MLFTFGLTCGQKLLYNNCSPLECEQSIPSLSPYLWQIMIIPNLHASLTWVGLLVQNPEQSWQRILIFKRYDGFTCFIATLNSLLVINVNTCFSDYTNYKNYINYICEMFKIKPTVSRVINSSSTCTQSSCQ